MKKKRKILITSALLYANGPIHLGHLVEAIQTDIWARFQRKMGHECYYICGSDSHGTAIMLQAEKLNTAPEAMVMKIAEEQLNDFKKFSILFDHYASTHTSINQSLVESFYQNLVKAGDIEKKDVAQFFDPVKQLFLPDRFIKGSCPKCGAADQYSDSCEACGAAYQPTELKDPRSVLSGVTPIQKTSQHYFFRLSAYKEELEKWSEQTLQPEIVHKLEEWFKVGLESWNISRDAPYFGFKIPNTNDKYFYVWLDAPIGYLSIFKEFCASNNLDFEAFLKADSSTEIYHFIGKDIIYFHALFWPALLRSQNYRLPTTLFVHGMLTINGKKMSKSRGTFIQAKTYLHYLNPEYLRYYYATKLTPHLTDIDLNLEEFRLRVNADLVGKVINIASRCAAFITRFFNNQLADHLIYPELYQEAVAQAESIAQCYETLDFSRATREIMLLADKTNQWIDIQKPWDQIKVAAQKNKVQAICTMGLNLFRLLIIYLQPILPVTAEKVKRFLQDDLNWEGRTKPLLNQVILPFTPLLERLEQKSIDSMLEASQENLNFKGDIMSAENKMLTLEEFQKIDLRVAKIIEAQPVEGSDKLLKLTLDLGNETRQVFSGIRTSYPPEQLVGRLVVMVANLMPRKMRFGISEGMVLAAGNESGIYMIAPDTGAQAGDKVK